MKTYQIFQTVSVEYFVEANSEDEAIHKIVEDEVAPSSSEPTNYEIADIHDGESWGVEKL